MPKSGEGMQLKDTGKNHRIMFPEKSFFNRFRFFYCIYEKPLCSDNDNCYTCELNVWGGICVLLHVKRAK